MSWTVLICLTIAVVVLGLYLHARPDVVTPAATLNEPAINATSAMQAAPTRGRPLEDFSPPVAPVTPAPSQGPRPEQMRQLRALQDNCQRVTRLNAQGEYPALQTVACNDYARFAKRLGFDAGALPQVAVTEPARRSRSVVTYGSGQASPNVGLCVSLEQAKQSINAATRQLHSAQQAERYREQLRRINAEMWDLNCRNH